MIWVWRNIELFCVVVFLLLATVVTSPILYLGVLTPYSILATKHIWEADFIPAIGPTIQPNKLALNILYKSLFGTQTHVSVCFGCVWNKLEKGLHPGSPTKEQPITPIENKRGRYSLYQPLGSATAPH